LINAAPSPARDLLAELTRLAPRLEEDTQLEVIAEAALVVVETGATPPLAIKQATSSVLRDLGRLWQAKPLEDCYWL
jgi:hypothetical protein